jgi:hypothetical protein
MLDNINIGKVQSSDPHPDGLMIRAVELIRSRGRIA